MSMSGSNNTQPGRDPSAARSRIGDPTDALMDAMLDGELDAQGREDLARRLRADPRRAAEFASLQSTVAMLRAAEHAPQRVPDFARSVVREVSFRESLADPLLNGSRGRSGSWALPTALAAGMALAATVGLLLLRAPAATPPSQAPRSTIAVAPATEKLPTPRRTAHVPPPRSTALPMGPSDRHEIAGKWGTELDSTSPSETGVLPSGRELAHVGDEQNDPAAVAGRLISVRVGPAWSLWWIPGDSADQKTPGSEPWRLLSRLATPTNASVVKPEGIDKSK